MSDVTRILADIRRGDHGSQRPLLICDGPRRLAPQWPAREAPGPTLRATASMLEASLRLVGAKELGRDGRGHFFAAAAEAMRRILVERARYKHSRKHGGGSRRVDLDEVATCAPRPGDELLALNEALDKLAEEDPRKAELVKLRYFTGLSVQEAADVLGVSRATADRWWGYAKAWLYCAISGEDGPTPG